MSYSFKLKNGAKAVFDPESAILCITTIHGDVNSSTLGRAESRLLDLLLMEPGLTKTRDEIIDYTWNDRVVASGSLNQAVFSLRNILNDSRDHEILMTIPRRGYCFNRDYLIDEQADTLPSDTAEQAYLPPTEHVPATHPTPIQSSLKKTNKLNSTALILLAGYAATLIVCAVTFVHSGLSFDTPKIELASSNQAEVTVHALSDNLADAQLLRDTSAQHVQKLPPHLKGEIWINQSKSNYSVSCVRADLSTANFQFNSQQKDLAAMIQQCLETAI